MCPFLLPRECCSGPSRYNALTGIFRAHRVFCAAKCGPAVGPAGPFPTRSLPTRVADAVRVACAVVESRREPAVKASARAARSSSAVCRIASLASTVRSTLLTKRTARREYCGCAVVVPAALQTATTSALYKPALLMSEPAAVTPKLKSEHRSLWALNPRKSERSSLCALNLCKSERRSQWSLNSLGLENSSQWALNLFKQERSTPQALIQSRKWERRSPCALNSRRHPGRSMERSPPTGTRKTPTRYSSSRVVRASANRPATRSEDLLPTSSFNSACARARCTTGGTFSWPRSARKRLRKSGALTSQMPSHTTRSSRAVLKRCLASSNLKDHFARSYANTLKPGRR